MYVCGWMKYSRRSRERDKSHIHTQAHTEFRASEKLFKDLLLFCAAVLPAFYAFRAIQVSCSLCVVYWPKKNKNKNSRPVEQERHANAMALICLCSHFYWELYSFLSHSGSEHFVATETKIKKKCTCEHAIYTILNANVWWLQYLFVRNNRFIYCVCDFSF